MRDGLALLCALCLSGAAWSAQPVKLMFGAPTRHKDLKQFMDFQYVTPGDALADGSPWGWTDAKKVKGWVFDNQRRATFPLDGLLAHTMECEDGRFTVRVPKGRAAVHVWTGHMYKANRRTYRILAQGKLVVHQPITTHNVCSEKLWLRGQSDILRTDIDRWVRQARPMLDEYDFTVDVADGALDLRFQGPNLCAMVVLPGGDAPTMKALLAGIEKERRRQFEKRYPWKPKPDEPMPEVRAQDRERGFVLFEKLIDDEVLPWTRPRPNEITDTIRAFAAQGEQEAFRFGVLPLRRLDAFHVSVGDFAGPGGARVSTSDCADIWSERYAERGGQRGEPALDPVSDVCLDRGPTDYGPGMPRMFTVDLRVPADAPAGFYRAPLRFQSAGKQIARAELLLRVLPWHLDFAPVPFTFQATLMAWNDLIDSKDREANLRRAMEKRVKFIGKYGFSASYFWPMWGFGTITGKPGARRFTQTQAEEEKLDWWFRLVMEHGNAKHWIQYHWMGYFTSRGRWRPYKRFSRENRAKWTAQDEEDLVRCIRDFNDICRKKGYPPIYWYGCGEPDNFGLPGVEFGNWCAQLVHRAGGKTLCALNGPIGNKLCPPHHDIVCANHATPISEEFISRVKKLGHKFGSHNTGMSRFAAGYQLWRMGACTKFQEVILYVAYTFPYTYLPWNYKAASAYTREDGGWRPTVRWLRYRDGRDDFMYMYNLEQRIARANAAGLGGNEAVKAAGAFVERMTATISVDPKRYHRGAVDAKEAGSSVAVGWTPLRLARYRWLVATLVMDLDKALAQSR